jgi:hypothetical protein
MTTALEYKSDYRADFDSEIAGSWSSGSENGVFRRYPVGNNAVNFIDPLGLTWDESLTYFWKWATGQPMPTNFGPYSNQVNDMKDAPGVQKARKAFYKKNAGKPCGEWEPLTNYKADFGLKGLWKAGTDPTEQFVGSYRVDIIPNSDGTLNINLYNSTSFTSFSYGLGPNWNGGPGGTQTQIYHWTEEKQ